MGKYIHTETPLYSIVIPVYKSGAWMDELVERIGKAMEQEAPGAFELILVNDCSPDTVTWAAIQRNADRHVWVRGFDLFYNVGQFRATMCGLEQARGRNVITMDDDLQHVPEELPKLMCALAEHPDALCVMGRFQQRRQNCFRNMGSRLYQRLLNRLYGKPGHIYTSGFRIMTRELVDALLACRTTKPQISPLIVSLTPRVVNVEINHLERKHGGSGYSIRKLVDVTLENVVSASTMPLRMFSLSGFLIAGATFLLSLFFLLRWLAGGIGVPGFITQILLTMFFGGMTLVGIGIVGEYVGRMIAEVAGPERYRIRRVTENEQ